MKPRPIFSNDTVDDSTVSEPITDMTGEKKLQRTIGLPGAIVLGLGSMVGTGAFIAIGLAAGIANDLVWIAVLIGGGLAMLNGLSSARLAARHPVSGGTYEYGYRELHPSIGVGAGWLFLTAKSASAATASMGIAGYLAESMFVSSAPTWSLGLPILAMAVLAVVGLRCSLLVTAVLVSLAMAALLGFVAWGFGAVPLETATVATSSPPSKIDLVHAGGLVFVAFTGYGRIATLGEEIRDPARSIPTAVVITVLVSATLYLLVGLAATRIAGGAAFGDLAGAADGPLITIADAAGGSWLVLPLAIGACAAMGGVLLNLILGLSRVVLAMGRRHDLPPALAHVGKGEPVIAIAVVAVTVLIVATTGSILTAWSGSAAAVLAYYAITNLAALRMSLRDRRRTAAAASGLGALACIGVACSLPATAWGPPAIALFAGLCISLLSRLSRRPPSAE